MRYLLIVLVISLMTCGASLAADRGFCFVQIADTQLGFGDNKNLAPEIETFRKAIAEINRLKPAFVLISGDLVNASHDPKQIRAFWNTASEIDSKIPMRLVAGNHDIGAVTEANVKSYRRLFGDDWYGFSCGDSEFIVLDTNLIADANADPALRDAQRKWLEDALAKARSRNAAHIFVCGHHPWFTEAADEPDQYFNVPTAQRQDYLKLFEESGVDYLLAGHWHRNAIAQAGKLHMITTSSIAQPLGSDPSGMRLFRVYGDRVEQEFVPLGKAVGAAK